MHGALWLQPFNPAPAFCIETSAMLTATSLVSDMPTFAFLESIGNNLPPILFLVLIGVCAMAIVVAAVLDMLPAREAGGEGDAQQDDASAAAMKNAKIASLKAKAEEKARKKAAKTAGKAAKGKKGKSKAEPTESAPAEIIDVFEPE